MDVLSAANALAMDIRRHLDFEPVLACPPSPTYRMGKFVRRNRIWVARPTPGGVNHYQRLTVNWNDVIQGKTQTIGHWMSTIIM